jgi:hypothetical protein
VSCSFARPASRADISSGVYLDAGIILADSGLVTESPAPGSAAVPPAKTDHEQMLTMITGYWVTQVLRAVAMFSVPEHLAAGAATAEQVAAAAGTEPEATSRLLRACVSLGLVTSPDGSCYQSTPLLETLRADRPASLRGMALAHGAPGHWQPWGQFPDAVRTGKRQTTTALGTEIFDYYAQAQEEARHFTSGVASLSAMVTGEVARVLDTSQCRSAADVGGGSGTLLHSLMQANPRLHGVLLDLPHVVPDSVAAAASLGLAARFTAEPGDFFTAVPPADLYLLKMILHDWDDEQCVAILANCRASMSRGGRIAVVEQLVDGPGEAGLAPLMDLNMLAMVPGRERAVAEFDRLFAASGLRRTDIIPTRSPFTILVAETV